MVGVDGICFDARGVVLLASTRSLGMVGDTPAARAYVAAYCGPDFESALSAHLPRTIEGLPVHARIQRVHLLMTAEGSAGSMQPIATLNLQHVDGLRAKHSIR